MIKLEMPLTSCGKTEVPRNRVAPGREKPTFRCKDMFIAARNSTDEYKYRKIPISHREL